MHLNNRRFTALFANFTNQQFIDFIINNEKSLMASVHRKTYFNEVLRFGTQYYCLSKKKSVLGLKRALATVYLDFRLGHINLDQVHLHDMVLTLARQQFHDLKKEEQAVAKRLELEKEEILRFLFGE